MDFSETLEIKVVDRERGTKDQADGEMEQETTMTMDSYFFAYFHNLGEAMEQIREAVRSHRQRTSASITLSPPTSPQPAPALELQEAAGLDPFRRLSGDVVTDTTVQRTQSTKSTKSTKARKRSSMSSVSDLVRGNSGSGGGEGTGFKLPSLLRPFSSGSGSAAHDAPRSFLRRPTERSLSSGSISAMASAGEETNATIRPSAIPLRAHTTSTGTDSDTTTRDRPSTPTVTSPSPIDAPHPPDHTYPPSTESSLQLSIHPTPSHRSSWSVGVPSWLKAPSRRLFSSASASQISVVVGHDGDSCTEVLDSGVGDGDRPSAEGHGQMGFSILEAPPAGAEHAPDKAIVDKFRAQFALDEKEVLLGCELLFMP